MDSKTFMQYHHSWTEFAVLGKIRLNEFFDLLFGLLSLLTLVCSIFIKKLRAHAVVTHCLLVNSCVFLFDIALSSMSRHIDDSPHIRILWLFLRLVVVQKMRLIWASLYISYLTVYLCVQQLIFLIGSQRLSKLFRGVFLHFSLITILIMCYGIKLSANHCLSYPIIASSQNSPLRYKEIDPETQALQFYVLNTSTLILVLILCLIKKIRESRPRNTQVYAESQEEDQKNGNPNSFWVFFWFVSLITLKLLAALNMTLKTFDVHPSLAVFSFFNLCKPQILSQVAILLAAWFSASFGQLLAPKCIVDQQLFTRSAQTAIIRVVGRAGYTRETGECLRIHPVALNCLFVVTFAFLIGLAFLLSDAVSPLLPEKLGIALQVMMVFILIRVRAIWAATYLNSVTIYLCFRQLIFLIGSRRVSKLFQGVLLHIALIAIAFVSRGSGVAITNQCFNFPIIASSQNSSLSYKSKQTNADPQRQAIQFYVLNSSTLILVLIVYLVKIIREKMPRSSQVYTESQEEDQRNERYNSFWVFFWFVSLTTLKLLAALNVSFGTVNLHPSLALFSHFILCQPQILSQVAILLAAWFSGLSNYK